MYIWVLKTLVINWILLDHWTSRCFVACAEQQVSRSVTQCCPCLAPNRRGIHQEGEQSLTFAMGDLALPYTDCQFKSNQKLCSSHHISKHLTPLPTQPSEFRRPVHHEGLDLEAIVVLLLKSNCQGKVTQTQSFKLHAICLKRKQSPSVTRWHAGTVSFTVENH